MATNTEAQTYALTRNEVSLILSALRTAQDELKPQTGALTTRTVVQAMASMADWLETLKR